MALQQNETLSVFDEKSLAGRENSTTMGKALKQRLLY
jgi:hypothetical protein